MATSAEEYFTADLTPASSSLAPPLLGEVLGEVLARHSSAQKLLLRAHAADAQHLATLLPEASEKPLYKELAEGLQAAVTDIELLVASLRKLPEPTVKLVINLVVPPCEQPALRGGGKTAVLARDSAVHTPDSAAQMLGDLLGFDDYEAHLVGGGSGLTHGQDADDGLLTGLAGPSVGAPGDALSLQEAGGLDGAAAAAAAAVGKGLTEQQALSFGLPLDFLQQGSPSEGSGVHGQPAALEAAAAAPPSPLRSAGWSEGTGVMSGAAQELSWAGGASEEELAGVSECLLEEQGLAFGLPHDFLLHASAASGDHSSQLLLLQAQMRQGVEEEPGAEEEAAAVTCGAEQRGDAADGGLVGRFSMGREEEVYGGYLPEREGGRSSQQWDGESEGRQQQGEMQWRERWPPGPSAGEEGLPCAEEQVEIEVQSGGVEVEEEEEEGGQGEWELPRGAKQGQQEGGEPLWGQEEQLLQEQQEREEGPEEQQRRLRASCSGPTPAGPSEDEGRLREEVQKLKSQLSMYEATLDNMRMTVEEADANKELLQEQNLELAARLAEMQAFISFRAQSHKTATANVGPWLKGHRME